MTAKIPGVPSHLSPLVHQAAALALEARAAAQAGDHERAALLRAEYDWLFDDIEAQALAAQPAPELAPELAEVPV